MSALDIAPARAARPGTSLPTDRYWKIDYAKIDLGAGPGKADLRFEIPDAAHKAGIVLCSLGEARARHPELVARGLGAAVANDESRFTQRAADAPDADGFFCHVPANARCEEPLTIVFGGGSWFGRGVVVVEEHAQAMLVERAVSSDTELICGNVEVVLEAKSRLDYVGMQTLGASAQSFMTRRALVARDAVIAWSFAELGAALSKSVLDAELRDEGASVMCTALCFATGSRHLDLANDLEHQSPATRTNVVVKGAASAQGRVRYYGNIRMRAHAHNCEATLRDDALLLSPDAHIDSVPALEIAANDVRAFHGATVGTVDDEQRFYAMSRGLAADEAERMITLGFFEPAIARFPLEAQRELLRTELAARVDADHR